MPSGNFITPILSHISFVMSLALLISVFFINRKSSLRTAFTALIFMMVVWNLGTILEMDLRLAAGETGMAFINLCYVAICLSPLAILYLGCVVNWTAFVLRPHHALFLVVPFLSIIMVVTNPLHGLFFRNFSVSSAEAVYGVYYYFHSAYSYICILIGMVMLVAASIRTSGFFSYQSFFLFAGILIPVGANILYSFNIMDLPFNINASLFTVGILCFFIALNKFKFLTVVPVSVRQIVDLISDGYLVLDTDYNILDYNKALQEMLPLDISGGPGQNPAGLLSVVKTRDDRNALINAFSRVKKTRDAEHMEIESCGERFFELEITPIFNKSHHMANILLVKDITEKKKSIDLAKAESKYKSEFLSMMSHELRTPINAITGMTEIGIHSGEKERMIYCLEKIDSASRHLLGIINNILDMSKIEANKYDLFLVPFEFTAMVEQVETMIRFRTDSRSQRFLVETDSTIPKVIVGDEQRLSQVIINLLSNSVKFTHEGGSIVLKTKLVSADDRTCVISVEIQDNGIGMTADQQKKLFQTFTQADSSISRRFGGTGLGLALSKRIVELMGGKIQVQSDLDKGSLFIFTFKAEIGSTAQLQKAVPDTVSLDGIFRDRKVLLAEDVDINREIILAFLEETKAVVESAENGKLALDMYTAAKGAYDIILMDIQMPEMDGYEAARKIREAEQHFHGELPEKDPPGAVPIIAMTANVLSEDVARCIQAGMNGHLGKPLNRNDLIQTLRNWLV